MDKQTVVYWLTSQIWQVPFLALYLFGFIWTMSGRWTGGFLKYAAWGFGLLVAGWALSAFGMYLMYARISSGGGYSADMGGRMLFTLASSLAHFGGVGLLIAAIFSGRRTPPAPAG